MARLEAPVRTAVRFTSGPVPVLPSTDSLDGDTLSIEFDGHEVGWVIPVQLEGQPKHGPTVTLLLDEDTLQAWLEALEVVQRFLSALAFDLDTRMESRARAGGSGTTDLLHPYGSVGTADALGTYLVRAPGAVHVDPDPRARLALAVYREGLCAASPFYSFLSFWNVIEAVHEGNGTRRNAFVRRVAPASQFNPSTVQGDIAKHLREESRNAIAHVIRSDPTNTSIDPDRGADRDRLEYESRWLQDIARTAILERWPNVVRTDPRP